MKFIHVIDPHFVTPGETLFRLDLGPATKLVKTHENPGYSVVLLTGDTVVVHDHSYLEEGAAFEYADYGKPEKQTAAE